MKKHSDLSATPEFAQTELNSSFVLGFVKPEANQKTKEIFNYFKRWNFELIYSKRVLLKKWQVLSYYARDDGWKRQVGGYALYSHDPHYKYSPEECLAQGEIILQKIIEYMISDEIELFIFRLPLERGNAIEKANQLIGYTNPRRALPGTIRWDLFHKDENLSSINDEDGFLFNFIDLCKEEKDMAEAIAILIPEKDSRKYKFLSHIKI